MCFLRVLIPLAACLYLVSGKPASSIDFLSLGDTAKADYKNFMPACSGADEQIISHHAYCLSYSQKYRQARWIAYRLTAQMCGRDGEERSNNFRADPAVNGGSATPADYTHSGFDRGHLCPAGDMCWDAAAMSESFLMSNMSPQTPGFNRGIWKKLETDVRCWAIRDDELIVVAGGVLHEGLQSIGNGHVAVPEYFYKVVYDVRPPQLKAIAFLMPNLASKQTVFHFAVSIDSVERLTGIDFFPELPDTLEEHVESLTDTLQWSLSGCMHE